MNYVLADIHGAYTVFMDMLEQIQLNSHDTLYVLGDMADWGPDSLEVWRWLRGCPNARVLRGNHDQLLLDYFQEKPGAAEAWLGLGGRPTLAALQSVSCIERLEILNWLDNLPYYFLVEKYILVHGGLRVFPHQSLEELLAGQEPADFLSIRDDFYTKPAVPNHTVVFGHSRTRWLPGSTGFRIWHDPYHHDKIGIDCGVIMPEEGGCLGCLRLDDMQEYYAFPHL